MTPLPQSSLASLQPFITSRDIGLLIGLERERSPAIAVLVCYGPGALIWFGFAMLVIMLAIAHSWRQLSTGKELPMPEVKNSTKIRTSLTFGLLYAAVLFFSAGALRLCRQQWALCRRSGLRADRRGPSPFSVCDSSPLAGWPSAVAPPWHGADYGACWQPHWARKLLC